MVRIACGCLAGMIAGLLATTAFAAGAPIMPGESIGDVRLGQDVTGVLTALGPLHSLDDFPTGTLTGYFWPLRRIGVVADKATNKIVAVAVSLDDTYQTEKGIAPGAELEVVRAAYGQEESMESHQDGSTLVYDKLGVAFVVDQGGALENRVSVIFVFTPGRYHDIFTR